MSQPPNERTKNKQKSVETTSAGGSTRGSQSESVSSLVSQDYRRKCDPAEKAYEAKREKEPAIMQCKELEFLMIDPLALPAAKRAIIERGSKAFVFNEQLTLKLAGQLSSRGKIGENACKLELPTYMELYFVVNVDKLKLFEPSMLDDEPGESLPSVDDLVAGKIWC
ncbi:hypothetical protein Tco_0529476 [Tanacetum coccineum]